MFGPHNYASLLAEFTNDPAVMGYAAHLPAVSATQFIALAALLNAGTGSGAGVVVYASVPKDQVLFGLTPALEALGQASASIQTQFTPLLTALCATDNLTISAGTIGALGNAVTAGLMTLAQAQAIYQYTGTRLEVLYGAGSVANWLDVARTFYPAYG